jgi:hypothetical protein
MWNAWERRGIHTGFWFETLKEGDRLQDPDVDGRMTFKSRLKKQDERFGTGLIGLKIKTGGGLL